MKLTSTAQQRAFFTQNGYLELEGLLSESETLFASMQKALHSRLPKDSKTPQEQYKAGRDLWRHIPTLKALLLRKLAPLAIALTGKDRLRLACDQWIPADYPWKKMATSKDLFSIQGMALGVLIAASVPQPPIPSTLGLLPLPSQSQNILFFKPGLILDFPQLAKYAPSELYLAFYAFPNSMYIQNLNDPSTNSLKLLGYGFGDSLINEHHPLIIG
jgi:hypothetical protein